MTYKVAHNTHVLRKLNGLVRILFIKQWSTQGNPRVMVTYLSIFSVQVRCRKHISEHPFNSTLRQGVCAESIKSSLKVFVLFVLHAHTVLPHFSCATSIHTIDGEKYSNVITVNSKASFFHVLS